MKTVSKIAGLLVLLLVSCKEKTGSALPKDEYYTCSMHPQVMQDKPGTCPICHMELIVVKRTNTAADEIMLNEEQVRLGNIRVDTVKNGTIGDRLVLTATLNADETRVASVNARVTGRIDRLYFRNVGDYVPKGAHLYDLYSEELNNAKQEYVAAIERKEKLDNSIIDFNRLIESARTKLILWGMTEQQVAELARNRNPGTETSFYSQTGGYITELPVMEGQYVMEGATVVRIADLSSLWAEAQVYASEMSFIDRNGTATLTFPDLPGLEVTGKISFVNPEIAPDTRVNLLRVTVPGNGQLRPGMPAYVTMRTRDVSTLTLPADAVLRNGKMSLVWLQTGPLVYRMKMVETGLESGAQIAIKKGLENGDVVVTSGAYLLNSEYIFKKGADAMGSMSGHQH